MGEEIGATFALASAVTTAVFTKFVYCIKKRMNKRARVRARGKIRL